MKFQIEQAVEILEHTLLVLRSLLSNSSNEWIENSENSEDWGVFDIVGHYIHGEEPDWIQRAKIIFPLRLIDLNILQTAVKLTVFSPHRKQKI